MRWPHHEATTWGVIFQPCYVNEPGQVGGGNYPLAATTKYQTWHCLPAMYLDACVTAHRAEDLAQMQLKEPSGFDEAPRQSGVLVRPIVIENIVHGVK